MNYEQQKTELAKNGFSIINNFYTAEEVDEILKCIETSEQTGDSFMKTRDLFAIRQLIKNIPDLKKLIFNSNLLTLLGSDYFLTKAIYFDKPSQSNWFVAYHQDLSISVNEKAALPHYTNWTYKKEQYGVQPPIQILEDTVTVRIHLDKTNSENGALKVIPKSHLNGVIRPETKEWNLENESICEVDQGGVMLMKPLTLHASSRTTNGKRRRVIHLEFNKHSLQKPLTWLEYYDFSSSYHSV
ncbi:phytanoyl-CoA dioxygenase family protein [Leeuwenhoekiella nanhaiensis]|uniref:Phytanoyl-CoA dioxygenase n=1 Tax=Leeuwenhoekiella nanhaiensis TaxID=1655491 RepID=A0A2G1VRP7_9FLAO|nr:phytanoyl-CoA dioxygenase family protein [Leeuwenhoekiella nanhaiensis]PHQ29129.1 phytanoyl-CoA dioxygenase [Leeuwenhoekiella nanhaiensis]